MILDLIEVTVRWDMRCKSERAALEQQQQQEQQPQNQNVSGPAASSSAVAGVDPASSSLVCFHLPTLCWFHFKSNLPNHSGVAFSPS